MSHLDSSMVAMVCDRINEDASKETCFCFRSSKDTSGVLAPPLTYRETQSYITEIFYNILRQSCMIPSLPPARVNYGAHLFQG
jgi:hypothetical protein